MHKYNTGYCIFLKSEDFHLKTFFYEIKIKISGAWQQQQKKKKRKEKKSVKYKKLMK